MTVYTPSIPQPTDNPSNSQDQILQNFQTLNSVYGTSGDHYPWTNTTPTEGFRHAKVTLPQLPTANAPGNATPTPNTGEGAIYCAASGGISVPFWVRDNIASSVQYSMLGVRAFGTFAGSNGATVGTAMNLSATGSGGTYTVTINNSAVTTNGYTVLLTPLNSAAVMVMSYVTASTYVLTVKCANFVTGLPAAPLQFNVLVLQF
jgi:hypothetical protein